VRKEQAPRNSVFKARILTLNRFIPILETCYRAQQAKRHNRQRRDGRPSETKQRNLDQDNTAATTSSNTPIFHSHETITT